MAMESKKKMTFLHRDVNFKRLVHVSPCRAPRAIHPSLTATKIVSQELCAMDAKQAVHRRIDRLREKYRKWAEACLRA